MGGSLADRMSKHPLVLGALAEYSCSSPHAVSRPVRRAPQVPFAIVACFELAVLDTTRPQYERMFAWYRLLRIWASLRFDDHRGLVPSYMTCTPQGFHGTLVRTKTSGAGRKREELYVFVSGQAYILSSDWLMSGWRLWQAHASDRDFFLLLPSRDRHGVIHREAKYSDSQAMSRALVASLLKPDGQRLLSVPSGSHFWTEQSDRATLVSAAATLSSINADWLDELGRWSPRMSSTYIRTHKLRVGRIQASVAQAVRTSVSPSAFGEDDSYIAWARFMCDQGVGQDAAVSQASVLASFLPTHFRNASLPPIISQAGACELEEDLAAFPDAVESRHVEAEVPPLLSGTYVVSILKRGRFKRLHRVGECSLSPGIDYKSFEVLGEDEPSEALYSARCRNCFKGQPVFARMADAPDSPSEASTSES